MQRILAASDFSTRSQRALRRAGLLARQSLAELVLLHVVDDDQPATLVELEQREASRIFAEQLGSVVELRATNSRFIVTAGDPFDAIVRTAEVTSADLIVMGAHRKVLLRDIFVGTTIERVVRTAFRPVLMVNTEATRPYTSVLVAIDLSDASARAMQAAGALGLLDNLQVTVVHAFEAPAKSKLFLADVPRQRIEDYVAEEQAATKEKVAAFLRSLNFGSPAWSLRVEEGLPVPTVSRLVSQVQPDLLVIGTQGQSGVTKLLLGSVAEELLRTIEVDILAVSAGAGA